MLVIMLNIKKDFGFTVSYFYFSLTVIDDYTKNKFLNMKLEHLRLMRNIGNNYIQNDERYPKILIADKEYDERDQVSTSDEEKMIKDIKVLKLQRKNLMK